MAILIAKIIHIFGFVAWFCGLFYIGRLFVNHKESDKKSEDEGRILKLQFQEMMWTTYRKIANPSMMITWTAGLVMMYLYGMEWFKSNPWMHPKLTLIVVLTVIHVLFKLHIKKLEGGTSTYTANGYRYLSEIPILFLLGIVSLAVLKTMVNPMMLFGVFSLLIILGFVMMRIRNKG